MKKVDTKEFVSMMRGAAVEVRAGHELLSKLDSVGGDGDHGTTMVRAMNRMEEAVSAAIDQDLKTLLHDVGWAILGVDGGATGPLLGMFFVSMAESMAEPGPLDAERFAELFRAGLKGLRAQTKAEPGDKTVVDALVPAVEALSGAAGADASVVDMMRVAAEAAMGGAEKTKEMQARFGRARNIKEQSIGTQDPGATSAALLFKGFMKGLESHA